MDDARMTLMQHLEELRKRIVRAFVAWFVAFLVCYSYAEQMYLMISRPLREALLNPAVVESRGYLSAPGVQAVLQAHDANREDYSDLLLVLMNLEIWCRLFLDHRSADDVAGELAERARAA